MLAKDLIDRLERLGLLDQEIIEALREQLAQSGARVTPEAVAKLLVDNGQLTRFQATKLIGELRKGEYPDAPPAGGNAEDDLALLDGEDVAEAVEVTDDDTAVMAANAISYPASPTDNSAGSISADNATAALPSSSSRKVNTGKKVKDPNKSVWDSFKIYGVSAVIMVLLFVGAILYFVLSKGSADDSIKQANEFYNSQSFDVAVKEYEGFLKNFGEANPHSSIARTRKAMSELYLFSKFTDPARATKEAETILPRIENEAGLDEERNNLAALLVEIADNIAKAAGKATETPEKQRLLADLDRQIKLIENPAYVTGQAKTALAGQLLNVAETRSKVERDINRNLRLDETVGKMEASLKEQKTKEAYDARYDLLRDFPELKSNERLVNLVVSASGIQQKLVTSSKELPSVTNEPVAADLVKNIVLTSKSGEAVPGLQDEILYARVHGAVLAFSAVDGKLLWRRYVGYGQDHDPVPVNEGGQDGVLISDSQSLEIQSCDSQSGSIRWRTKIAEPFSQPISQGQEIYVAGQSGRLISIEAESGEPIWATQIPQPLVAGPGVNERTGTLYIAGDHSNLYILDKRGGQCAESFYIGHSKGTCAVPPISLQGNEGGHVFVFENAGVDYALMHILKCDEKGGALRVAQPPARLTGNVMVPPIMVLGRRLIVLTDRGQVAVFDIEQTAKVAEQVKLSAEQVASYDRPTSTQMAVGKNSMWVSGTRIGRFELQVSTGRVVRDWVFNEGDSFIGKPLYIGDTLFHARVLRGTSGVRVTAADPQTGKPFWHNDVGVPVSMLTKRTDGPGYHVITSQAALFDLDGQALADGATSGPVENPGGSGVAMRFERPLWIDEQRAVLLNQESGGQICVYDTTRAKEKLRLLSLAIPAGKAGGQGIIAGEGLMLPLNNGRVMLFDTRTGASTASPFQPPSAPNDVIAWTDAVTVGEDNTQVIIGDSRKKLYRLRASEQIRELAAVDLTDPLLGPMAIIGDTAIASSSGPAADFLLCFNTDSLEEKARVLLDGRIEWGPFATEEMVLLRTNDGMLRGYDAAGKPSMTPLRLPPGELVPGVKKIDNRLIITGRAGWIANIDSTNGELRGLLDLKQPLSALPMEASNRLLVPGAEGLVYITEIPESVEKQ